MKVKLSVHNKCALGWDHRVSGSYADSVYTNAVGAPDILLHYNYYEPPCGSKRKGTLAYPG